MRITDDGGCAANGYVIRVHGVVRGRGVLQSGRLMALGNTEVLARLPGLTIREPVFSTQAKWIGPDMQEEAALAGATVVTAMEVLSTHLMEVVKSCLSELLTLTALQRLIAELKDMSDPARAKSYQTYFDNMLPEKVSPELLLAVLRQMLDEGLSIRNLPLIVDAVHECRAAGSPEAVFEAIRRRLRGQITQRMSSPSGQLNIVQLHPSWEAEFVAAEEGLQRGHQGAVLPDLSRRLVARVRAQLAGLDPQDDPVIAAPDHRRRQLRDILSAHGLPIPVLGLADIDPSAEINLLATIEAG